MICTCDACHYTFNATAISHSKDKIPKRCPDCGKMVIHTDHGSISAVRAATDAEIKEYNDYLRELMNKMEAAIYRK